MERMIVYLRPEEKAALKALARVEQRTLPGMARRLVVEGLEQLGLYTDDLEATAKQDAIRELRVQLHGNGKGGSDGVGA